MLPKITSTHVGDLNLSLSILYPNNKSCFLLLIQRNTVQYISHTSRRKV